MSNDDSDDKTQKTAQMTECEVCRIDGEREVDGNLQYHVIWTDGDETWESWENLLNCEAALDDYYNSKETKQEKTTPIPTPTPSVPMEYVDAPELELEPEPQTSAMRFSIRRTDKLKITNSEQLKFFSDNYAKDHTFRTVEEYGGFTGDLQDVPVSIEGETNGRKKKQLVVNWATGNTTYNDRETVLGLAPGIVSKYYLEKIQKLFSDD